MNYTWPALETEIVPKEKDVPKNSLGNPALKKVLNRYVKSKLSFLTKTTLEVLGEKFV